MWTTVFDARIRRIRFTCIQKAGHRHGRQYVLKARATYPPDPGGNQRLDVVRQHSRLPRWGTVVTEKGNHPSEPLPQYLEPRVKLCLGLLVGMCSADDQGSEMRRGILGAGKPDTPPHRVAQEVRRGYGEVVQDSDEICDQELVLIGGGIMRFITRPMSPCID